MEIDKRICKDCKELKFRIRDGTYPNKKDSRFVDEMGSHWNGNVCPKCHSVKVKLKMQKLRKGVQEDPIKEIELLEQLNINNS